MKNNNAIVTICIFLSIIFSPIISFSYPLINTPPKTLSPGQQVTIIGSGFGVKSPAAPIIWANFNNGSVSPSSLGQRISWDASDFTNVNTTNLLPNSTGNVVGVWNSNIGAKSFSFRIDKTYWSTVYHFQKRYFDFDATGNQKYWRLWPVSGSNDMLALWHGATAGGGLCYNEYEASTGISGNVNGYQGSFPGKNQWIQEEFTWKFAGGNGLNKVGTPDPTGCTGYWDYRVNGVANQHRENVCNSTNNQVQLRTDNFTDSAYLPPDGSKVYMDDIYIDDTLARVMIGNNSTLATSTHIEPQIPSAWSDTSITVTVNMGSFQTGESVYLFVVDASGTASAGSLVNTVPILNTGAEPAPQLINITPNQ